MFVIEQQERFKMLHSQITLLAVAIGSNKYLVACHTTIPSNILFALQQQFPPRTSQSFISNIVVIVQIANHLY